MEDVTPVRLKRTLYLPGTCAMLPENAIIQAHVLKDGRANPVCNLARVLDEDEWELPLEDADFEMLLRGGE